VLVAEAEVLAGAEDAGGDDAGGEEAGGDDAGGEDAGGDDAGGDDAGGDDAELVGFADADVPVAGVRDGLTNLDRDGVR
jgi:hypothetical protein